MSVRLGVVMDPIKNMIVSTDSTLAMLLEAEHRGWEIYYFEPSHLFVRDGKAYGVSHRLHVFNDATHWFELSDKKTFLLSELDVILMRKDPPLDMNYIYITYLLELAERAGVKVFNKPQSLRDANEKYVTTQFPALCPPTLITSDMSALRRFWVEQQDIVCKPLDNMAGAFVFRVQTDDLNASVIFETLTERGNTPIMAQRFIPEITQGDKRILLINGEPIPYALARIPAPGELRGNVNAGATGVAQLLTDRDKHICRVLGPMLREKGLLFVGIDVIGDFLTEINVTSPGCIRELDEQCHLTIAKQLLDAIEAGL